MKSLTNSGRKSAALSPTPRVSVLTPKMRRLIRKSSVVSFDVFDTLLVRPYIRPTDLFMHIEREFDAPFFHDCRIMAEQSARKHTNNPDVTLDEIYNHIDDNFKRLKQKELDWERMVLRANPQMLEVYNFAKQSGKRIVIASDMYLPIKFVADVLHKNGFDGYEQLYVSGESGVTKTHGTMFQRIIQDTGVKPKHILHIGDNRNSDYKKPRKYGIRSVLYRVPVREFIRKNARIADFHDKTHDNLGASILVGVLAYRDLLGVGGNYWHKLGYEYAGPVIYGYTRWIERAATANGIDNLLFVARDGYTLQRVFNTFNDKIKNSYIYAPRFLNLICRLDYAKRDKKQSKAIVDYFSTKDKKIEKLETNNVLETPDDYDAFIQNNIKLFTPLAKVELNKYQEYLKKYVGKSKHVAVIDTLTVSFSSQKLIESALKHDVMGLYWNHFFDKNHSSLQTKNYNHRMFIENGGPTYEIRTKNWNFMEFLMTAPEYPVKNLGPDGNPIYTSSPSEMEKFRKRTYLDVSDGAVMFANDIKSFFNNANIYLDGKTVVCWVNCLCDNPTKQDFNNMLNVYHAWDSDHTCYQPLFCAKIRPLDYVFHLSRTKKLIIRSLWRSPFQSFVAAITTPVRVKHHRLKQIQIILFPKLRNTYFFATVRFTNKCFYGITVGKSATIK